MARESVLDLSFATPALAGHIQDWQVLPDLGSDHYGILFTVTGTNTQSDLVESPLYQAKFNTALAD